MTCETKTETVKTPMDLDTATAEIKQLPLADLQAFCERFSKSDLMEIEYKLAFQAEYLARIAAYVNARAGYDAGHEKAVKNQNRVAAVLRKALGFHLAHHDLTF